MLRRMIIDCHGHYTTAPKQLNEFRETQTASLAIYDAIQANREADAEGMIVVLTALAMLVLYAVNKLRRRGGV